MTNAHSVADPAIAQAERPRGHGALRVLIILSGLAILAQALFAGMFLGGDRAMLAAHGTGALVVLALSVIQLVVAILYWRPWRGSGFPALASLVLVIATVVQSITGGSQVTAVHVPLGMLMFGLVIWLAVWALRPAAR